MMLLKRFNPASIYTALLLIGISLHSSLAHSEPACEFPGSGESDSGVEQRIVSIGGANTEILYALGLGGCIVAVDTSSTYPENTSAKPKVGYMRALSAEPILALQPSLIVTDAGAGPPEAIKHLQRFNIPLVISPAHKGLQSVETSIQLIGKKTGTGDKASVLVQHLSNDIRALKEYLDVKKSANEKSMPRVAFLMSLDSREALLAGSDTAADSMIQLAGGKNAATQFRGYKTVSGETLATLNPDVIVLTNRALQSLLQPLSIAADTPHSSIVSELSRLPALKFTAAAQQNAIHWFDTQFLLGFGPRSAQAGLALAQILYP